MRFGLAAILCLSLGMPAALAQQPPAASTLPTTASLRDLLRIADGLVEEARKADTGPQRGPESAQLLADAIARRDRIAERLRAADAAPPARP